MKVSVAVQYRILVDSAYDAYYRLTDPRNQIQSYVFDVVRSTVPKMELDEAFQAKEEVAEAVLMQLRDVMADYGYEIKQTLVTDLEPDARVKYVLSLGRLSLLLLRHDTFSFQNGNPLTFFFPCFVLPSIPLPPELR